VNKEEIRKWLVNNSDPDTELMSYRLADFIQQQAASLSRKEEVKETAKFVIQGIVILGIMVAFIAGIWRLGSSQQHDAQMRAKQAELQACKDVRAHVDEHVKLMLEALKK